MREHRSTQHRVSNNLPPDNFNAATALEQLHAAVLQTQTLLQVASDAVDQLATPSGPQARRNFARMQILVGAAADQASAALALGDDLMSSLNRHLEARRARARSDRCAGREPARWVLKLAARTRPTVGP